MNCLKHLMPALLLFALCGCNDNRFDGDAYADVAMTAIGEPANTADCSVIKNITDCGMFTLNDVIDDAIVKYETTSETLDEKVTLCANRVDELRGTKDEGLIRAANDSLSAVLKERHAFLMAVEVLLQTSANSPDRSFVMGRDILINYERLDSTGCNEGSVFLRVAGHPDSGLDVLASRTDESEEWEYAEGTLERFIPELKSVVDSLLAN